MACTSIALICAVIFLIDFTADYVDGLFQIKPELISTNFGSKKQRLIYKKNSTNTFSRLKCILAPPDLSQEFEGPSHEVSSLQGNKAALSGALWAAVSDINQRI